LASAVGAGHVDGVAATTTYFSSTLLVANVPTGITNGLKPVVVRSEAASRRARSVTQCSRRGRAA
jgi:hypothetical protein